MKAVIVGVVVVVFAKLSHRRRSRRRHPGHYFRNCLNLRRLGRDCRLGARKLVVSL